MVVLSMKTKQKFYREGDGYLMVTGESPKGFKGILFVVWEGDIDDLKEGVRTLDQLKDLEEVDDIDWEWYQAFAQRAGFDPEPKHVEVEKPKRKKTRANSRRRDAPLVEYVAHCAAGLDPVTAAVASGVMDSPQEECEDEPQIEVDPTFHGVVVSICALLGLLFYLFCLSCQ